MYAISYELSVRREKRSMEQIILDSYQKRLNNVYRGLSAYEQYFSDLYRSQNERYQMLLSLETRYQKMIYRFKSKHNL